MGCMFSQIEVCHTLQQFIITETGNLESQEILRYIFEHYLSMLEADHYHNFGKVIVFEGPDKEKLFAQFQQHLKKVISN